MGEPVATEQQQSSVATTKDENNVNTPDTASENSKDVRTVLMDPTDFNLRHPLQHRWCLWFDQIEQGKEWGINLTPIASFETVEDFWGLYNNIIKASELRNDCYFHLFKDGIKPKWEDQQNKVGGRFRFNLPKNAADLLLNQLWLSTILSLIGEQLPGAEDVAGAHIYKKAGGPRIELWVKCSQVTDRVKLEKMGKGYKELLKLNEALQFKPHDEHVKRSQRAFNV
eukprot:TRINITY_DN49810_c0_g1_i1.p2 TRINITY_DN49810_c0_g1~~TRINITY_DN49810_c0_g1_i1.p2  ORF type:complete len:226 (-),score=22.14 TRINITY_DN49810_c0_g1_i1:915-1592(-)